MIVSTSTLELGIDVGDLDRVIQIDAPRSVASFLQRLGRTGRRPGTTAQRTVPDHDHGRAAPGRWPAAAVVARLRRARRCAAKSATHRRAATSGALPPGGAGRSKRLADMVGRTVHLRRARRRDHRLARRVAPPRIRRRDAVHRTGSRAPVRTPQLHGPRLGLHDKPGVHRPPRTTGARQGRPHRLTRKVDGPRIIVLAARSWEVTYIDWKRQRCYVEPSDVSAKMRWMGDAAPLSFALARAERDVLLGDDPTVTISKRATAALEEIRADHTIEVSPRGFVLAPREGRRPLVDLGRCSRQRDPDRRAARTSLMTPSDPTTSESDCAESKQPRSSALRWRRWCGRTFCRRSQPPRLPASSSRRCFRRAWPWRRSPSDSRTGRERDVLRQTPASGRPSHD